MEPIAITTLSVAVIVIVSRGALMLAPTATLRAFQSLVAKPSSVRMLGAVLALLGTAWVRTAPGAAALHPTASAGLSLLGWLLLTTSAWLLLWPGSYQLVGTTFLEAIRDTAVVRLLGALGTVAGGALAWLAFELA